MQGLQLTPLSSQKAASVSSGNSGKLKKKRDIFKQKEEQDVRMAHAYFKALLEVYYIIILCFSASHRQWTTLMRDLFFNVWFIF